MPVVCNGVTTVTNNFYPDCNGWWVKKGLKLPYVNKVHLENLIRNQRVVFLSQLFELSDNDWISVGMKPAQVRHIQNHLSQVARLTFANRLLAMSIPGVGQKKAHLLAQHYQDFEQLKGASVQGFAEYSQLLRNGCPASTDFS